MNFPLNSPAAGVVRGVLSDVELTATTAVPLRKSAIGSDALNHKTFSHPFLCSHASPSPSIELDPRQRKKSTVCRLIGIHGVKRHSSTLIRGHLCELVISGSFHQGHLTCLCVSSTVFPAPRS